MTYVRIPFLTSAITFPQRVIVFKLYVRSSPSLQVVSLFLQPIFFQFDIEKIWTFYSLLYRSGNTSKEFPCGILQISPAPLIIFISVLSFTVLLTHLAALYIHHPCCWYGIRPGYSPHLPSIFSLEIVGVKAPATNIYRQHLKVILSLLYSLLLKSSQIDIPHCKRYGSLLIFSFFS